MSFDFPSPVTKSEGSPSAGSGQAFDFAQYRFSTPRRKTCPWGPRLWGTLIVVGIAPGDRDHPQIVIEYRREVVYETQKNIHRPD
jgi:hypothetical protein